MASSQDKNISDLAQHVGSQQVVLVLQNSHRGDGRLVVEAVGLPAVIPAAALPQIDAEDLPRSATVKQDGNLERHDGSLLLH